MECLNFLEKSILQAILDENCKEYPFLLVHYPLLRVKNREYTGVGSFTNFDYSCDINFGNFNKLLSSRKRLFIDGLEVEVTFVLTIANGRISFLELVTNGDEIWDGKVTNFSLV